MEDLSWIICEGSRSSDKCPNKGEKEGEFSEGREEGSVPEAGVMWPQVKEHWTPWLESYDTLPAIQIWL